jgi:NAD(P)-dependent dehydrogenase (short-subunit alcohol dehydrogenase family)
MTGKPDATEFAGKRVLISGGTKGLGRATVDRFLAGGARVITSARGTLEPIDGVEFVQADLTTAEGGEALAKAALERQDERGKDIARCRWKGVDAQRAGRRGLLGAGSLHRLMNVADGGSDLVDEPLTGLGKGHASRRAVEEPHTERALQLADSVAEGRGRDPELNRRCTEFSPPGDHENGVQLGQAMLRHCPDIRDELFRFVPIMPRSVQG